MIKMPLLHLVMFQKSKVVGLKRGMYTNQKNMVPVERKLEKSVPSIGTILICTLLKRLFSYILLFFVHVDFRSRHFAHTIANLLK